MIRSFCATCLLAATVCAQNRVPPGNLYHRIYPVVPLIGAGTPTDPKRPMFVPPPSARSPKDRSGILGYQMQVSDDGKFALVEFVGASPAALHAVLNSNAPSVKLFEGGMTSKAAIEAEFKKYESNFVLDWTPLRVP